MNATHKARIVLSLLSVGGVAWWAGARDAEPGSSISVEAVQFDVWREQRLAYRIEAAVGTMNEKTRQIQLERPSIRIFGENPGEMDLLTGERCEIWPEVTEDWDDNGDIKEVTRYDWELLGGVNVESQAGHRLNADRLRYRSATNKLISPGEIAFKFPTGRGGSIEGKADQFEARLDSETGRLSAWNLMGDVEFSYKGEPAPGDKDSSEPETNTEEKKE